METLWLPVSYLGFDNWYIGEPPGGPKVLFYSLDVGGICRLGGGFCLEELEGGSRVDIRHYNSLQELGDNPIDYKLAGREVPRRLFRDTVFEGVQWAIQGTTLGEMIIEALGGGPLPPDWQGSPSAWANRSLWLPLSSFTLYPRSSQEAGSSVKICGSVAIDRFFTFHDIYLALIDSTREPSGTLLAEWITSPRLRRWIASQLSVRELEVVLQRRDKYRVLDHRADPLQPIHLGYSPPEPAMIPA